MSFSAIDIAMQKRSEELRLRESFVDAAAWPEAERSQECIDRRRKRCDDNFWAWDETYFPAELYKGGKATPGLLQRRVVEHAKRPGIQLVIGPRKHGKTVTAKKYLAWALVTGRISVAGTYCETLPKASAMLDDIQWLLQNARVAHDYQVAVLESNADQLRARIGRNELVTVAAFSEGRSVRGYVAGFSRPQFLLADDIETLDSSFTQPAVDGRIRRLGETYQSLDEGGTVLVLANNFRRESAVNRLLTESEQGLLPERWNVHHYAAWHRGRPIWPSRFPATSEDALRALVGAYDDADWMGNYQGRPQPPAGYIFRREFVQFATEIPKDARGVVFVDPNLSKKSKGDTTGIARLRYSPTTELYYLGGCARSFSSAGELLESALDLLDGWSSQLGMDGNVSQESHWSQHIRSWCRIHKRPFPPVHFKRYHVDQIAGNLHKLWIDGLVRLEPSMANSAALEQLIAFTSKAAGNKDDFPDAAISAAQMLNERRMDRGSGQRQTTASLIIPDVY